MNVATNKIGVGIIGLSANGGWAATAHVPALRALSDNFEIVGLSSSSKESAQAAAEKHGVPFFTDDPRELAARPDVDLVVITVKVPYHRELLEAVADAGKAVYCEWPLGNGLVEAEQMARLAQSNGVKAFVGLQARSAPPIRYLRDLVRGGAIGEILSSTVVGSGGPPWGGVATSASAYATDRATGASMLTIPFGHTIDALRWVLGEFDDCRAELATRRAHVALSDTGQSVQASVADQIALIGKLETGTVISMHYRGGVSRGTNFLWEINGTAGDIVISGGIGHLQFGLVKMQAAYGDEKALSDLAVPDEYCRVDLPSTSMGYTVAHAYCGVYNELVGGDSSLPDFSDAVELHRLISRIETA